MTDSSRCLTLVGLVGPELFVGRALMSQMSHPVVHWILGIQIIDSDSTLILKMARFKS